MREDLNAAKTSASELRSEIEELNKTIARKDREIDEKEQAGARAESDAIVKLKSELGEALSTRRKAEEEAEKARKEKLALSGSFDRLKAQFEEAQTSLAEASQREEEFQHDKGVLARRLEKAEASNSELAARIKEDGVTALSSKNLIEKLETQIRENESEAVKREQKQVSELKAEISRLRREGHARTSERDKLQTAFDSEAAAHREAEEKVRQLHERIVELESENASTSKLLKETERMRAELTTRLTDESELATTRARTIDEQRKDLADTIARAKESERELLEKHRSEVEELDNQIRNLREEKAKVESELENTRVGMSEALRKAKEQAETEKAKILADGNAKLSEIEVELSQAIRNREDIGESKNQLEDELNEREERIERLAEHIEDLELKIRDEKEEKDRIRLDLQTTKEGLSSALASTRNHFSRSQKDYDHERRTREEVEANYADARMEIEKLKSEAEELQSRFDAEVKEWEERYDKLREEKLTLASEDANLKRIREQIIAAKEQKDEIEDELSSLSEDMKTFQAQHDKIKTQKNDLVKDREELKAGLNVARSELESIQRRCSDSQSHEAKLAETIESAEKRIRSLKKLEAEMEQAFERKRQKGILSRSEIFSEATSELISGDSEFSKEEFYKKLISRLDLIDDLSKRYDNKWRYPKVSDQLALLKGSFVDFLHDHSVREFQLDPGTTLSVEERKRIKLVPPKDANGSRAPQRNSENGSGSQVVETVRPGYVYQNGGKDVILRKAEVIVG